MAPIFVEAGCSRHAYPAILGDVHRRFRWQRETEADCTFTDVAATGLHDGVPAAWSGAEQPAALRAEHVA